MDSCRAVKKCKTFLRRLAARQLKVEQPTSVVTADELAGLLGVSELFEDLSRLFISTAHAVDKGKVSAPEHTLSAEGIDELVYPILSVFVWEVVLANTEEGACFHVHLWETSELQKLLEVIAIG